MWGALLLLLVPLVPPSAAAVSNVRSLGSAVVCEVDADCPVGHVCQQPAAAASSGGLLSQLLQLLASTDSTSSSPRCVASTAATAATASSEQSASEYAVLGENSTIAAVSCVPFAATVPTGTTVGLNVESGSFFSKNFNGSSVTLTATESRTGRRLNEGDRFSFSCDVEGSFDLYFSVALVQDGQLLGNSEICPVTVNCGHQQTPVEEEQEQQKIEDEEEEITLPPSTGASPRIVCYSSPITVNTDREIAISLEHVAYSLTLENPETGETSDAETDLLTLIRHQENGQIVGEGSQLNYQCKSSGAQTVNVIVAAFERYSGLAALSICPTTLQCNTASITATIDAAAAASTTTTTTSTSTTTTATAVSPQTAATVPVVSVTQESLDGDVLSAADLFTGIADKMESSVEELALLFNEVADSDQIESWLQENWAAAAETH